MNDALFIGWLAFVVAFLALIYAVMAYYKSHLNKRALSDIYISPLVTPIWDLDENLGTKDMRKAISEFRTRIMVLEYKYQVLDQKFAQYIMDANT